MKKSSTLVLTLAMAAMVSAQQLEMNSPGGNLTRAGTNPTVGVPFLVTVGNQIDVRVGGGGTAGFILLFSDQGLAAVSDNFGGIFGGQFLDLQQNGLQILVDGIGGLGLLPAGFGVTNAAGLANFSFPTNATIVNTEADFQGIVFDATQPFNLNFTAAACYQITTAVTFTGDETISNYALPLAAYTICGVTTTNVTTSANGWVVFGTETTGDFSETAGEFIAGNPGNTGVNSGRPLAAIMWEDLNMVAGTGSVTVNQVNPTTITMTWANGNYFSAPAGVWGTISMTIQDVGAGTTQITYDYTGFTFAAPPNEGIVGFSSGMAGATTTAADVSVMGAIVPFASGPGANNYFQSFDGLHAPAVGPAATPFDLTGQIMTTLVAADCSLVVF